MAAIVQHVVQDLCASMKDVRRSTSAQTQRLAGLPTKHAAQEAGVSMESVSPLPSGPKSSPVKRLANVRSAPHVVAGSVARSPSPPTPTTAVRALQRTAPPVNFAFPGNVDL